MPRINDRLAVSLPNPELALVAGGHLIHPAHLRFLIACEVARKLVWEAYLTRSVLLRVAGAVAAIAFWLGVVVVALNNLDTGLLRSEGLGGWPFFLATVAITVAIAFYLAIRRPGRPGWLHFVIGLLIPEVAFFLNRLFSTEIGIIFWIAVAVLILIPWPGRSVEPDALQAETAG